MDIDNLLNDIKATLFVLFMLAMPAFSQTQQGIIKTRGRMINGQHVLGKGLSAATVIVQGRSAVLSQDNGTFSFPIPAQTFMVQSVQKNGYQLVDPDATAKSYHYSANPLCIVMETPEQQIEDKLNAERKIRRTLQQQLQKKEDYIEGLKESHRITEEEYRQQLQRLYQSQENNEKLIADMAKEYSHLDYDQMDDLNRRISDAILNGRLTEADSLLRSKGDINSRIAEIKKEQRLETEEEKKLELRKKDLNAVKAVTRRKMEDAALDCSRHAELCRINHQLDSVTYYLELRAELDTLNASWQFDAAYSGQHSGSPNILKYYNRVCLLTQNNLKGSNLYLFSTSTNNIGAYYASIGNYQNAETYYQKGIIGRKKYAEQSSNPNDWNHVGWSLVSLCSLYIDMRRFEDSESCLKEASEIYEKIRPTYYEGNIFSYARLYDKWGWHYLRLGNLELSDSYYNKAWNSFKLANEKDPYPVNLYSLIEMKRELKWGFIDLYRKMQRENDLENYYLELKGLFQKSIPFSLKELEEEYSVLLGDFALFYINSRRYFEAEVIYKQALDIQRSLAKELPQKYTLTLATTLCNLSWASIFLKKYSQSEQYALEGISVDSINPLIYSNLAPALLFQGKYAKAEAIYHQYKDELKDDFFHDFRQFAEAGVIPKEREEDVERIKTMLSE